MKKLLIPLLLLLSSATTLAFAQESKRPYGMLFGGPQTITIPSTPQNAANLQQSLPSYPNQTVANKSINSNVLLAPPQIMPSAQPATFEEHEEEAKQQSAYVQMLKEQEKKAQAEAEKARANAPTVIVVQPPPPEVSLFNAITAVPAMFMRSWLR